MASRPYRDKSRSRDDQEPGGRLFAVGLALVLLVTASVLVAFIVNGLFKNSKGNLQVGVLLNPNKVFDQHLIDSANLALRDINIAVLRTPGGAPTVSLAFRNDSETELTAFERLFNLGIRVFVHSNYISEVYRSQLLNSSENCIFIQTDLEKSGLDFSQDEASNILSSVHTRLYNGPKIDQLARALLQLVNSTKDKVNEVVNVLPVMKEDTNSQFLYSALKESVKTFPGVRLMNPVVYTASQYPQSDALEVVSKLGGHVILSPSAQILILSPENLPNILGLLYVNPELKKRKWYSVDLTKQTEEILKKIKKDNSGEMISLTSLVHLEGKQNLLRDRFIKSLLKESKIDSTLYDQWKIYSTIIKVHHAFVQSTLNSQQSMLDRLQLLLTPVPGSTPKPSNDSQSSNESTKSGISPSWINQPGDVFLSILLMPDNPEVVLLPKIGWLIEGMIISEEEETELSYRPVTTSPLPKHELELLFESKKPSCSNPEFSLRLQQAYPFWPLCDMNLGDLDSLPTAVILPIEAKRGHVDVNLKFDDDASYEFTCIHSKLDFGDLICRPSYYFAEENSNDTIIF